MSWLSNFSRNTCCFSFRYRSDLYKWRLTKLVRFLPWSCVAVCRRWERRWNCCARWQITLWRKVMLMHPASVHGWKLWISDTKTSHLELKSIAWNLRLLLELLTMEVGSVFLCPFYTAKYSYEGAVLCAMVSAVRISMCTACNSPGTLIISSKWISKFLSVIFYSLC